NLAHWNLPSDNAVVKKILRDAVASGRLVPVVNREYRGLPRVAQPNAAPQRWAAPVGSGGYGYAPKVLNAWEFDALRRANGELPALDSGGSVVNATLAPRPALGLPATADDGFGLPGFVESAAGALIGGGDNDSGCADTGEADLLDDSGGGSAPLGDAQPFRLGDDPEAAVGDVEQDAGVFLTPAEEAECEMQYEADMAECSAYAAMNRSSWGICKERAMNRYASCLRGLG
ncbi:hypothetical protein BX588_1201, partial [Paraburkholderia eburnea]